MLLPENELKNIISFNKARRRKTNKVSKYNFTTFWYPLILKIIIILLLVFFYLKQSNNLYIIKNYIINDFNYKSKQKNTSKVNIINSNTTLTTILIKKINETYEKKGFVNLNEVESTIPGGRAWTKKKTKSKEINVGVGFDANFVLLSLFTIASIMDSQNLETKLRLHFFVVDGFPVEKMIKIYTLRDKIRDDVEFNFYNAKKVETDLKNTNPKGNGPNTKLILPELLPDDVERIIILDTGDTLILRDLSEMYNWNMEDKIYYGVLDVGFMKYGPFSKKELDIYINTGSVLIDVKKAKSEKIYEKIVENKNVIEPETIYDQDILNDFAYGKIGYLPMRFGLVAPFFEDYYSDSPPYKTVYFNLDNAKYKEKYNLPKNQDEMNIHALNPVIIHQWNGKWIHGRGLTIYRRIAQYYIRFSGIWDEICPIYPGLCKK